MKTLTIPFLILLVFSLSNCQEYSLDQETLDQIDSTSARHYSMLEEFDEPGDWRAFDRSEQPGVGYEEVDAASFISDGSLSMSVFQGTDCDRQKYVWSFPAEGDMQALLSSEDELHIEFLILSATTSALGSNSFSYRLGTLKTIVYFAQIEEPTTIELVLNEGEIVEVYSNGEIAENYWISQYDLTLSFYELEFESDACGPDLYAGAEMEIDRFSIFRTRD